MSVSIQHNNDKEVTIFNMKYVAYGWAVRLNSLGD